jgi:hypothetical protein
MTDTNTPLLRLIAKTPMLRTVQLADRLDISLDDVDAELRPHLVAGTVVEHEVEGPNNRKATAYDVSEQFKLTDAYRVAVGATGGVLVTVADAARDAANELASQREPAKAAKVSAERAPMTKVERAIALVTVLKSVPDADLHAELGLKKGDSVSSYVAAAKRDGRLVKTGDIWSLGMAALSSAEPVSAAPLAELPAAPLEVPRFIPDPVAKAPPKPPVTAAPAAKSTTAPIEQTKPADRFPGVDMDRAGAAAAAPTPGFRCAVWSDGVVHLERRGSITFELSPVEQDKLFAFLQHRA